MRAGLAVYDDEREVWRELVAEVVEDEACLGPCEAKRRRVRVIEAFLSGWVEIAGVRGVLSAGGVMVSSAFYAALW